VVLAEYAILQHDFPFLRTRALKRTHPALVDLRGTALRRAVHALIDRWLLANAAVVSLDQCWQTDANTAICTGSKTRAAYRPASYGRSLVVPVGPVDTAEGGDNRDVARARGAGLLDVKGAGVAPGMVPTPSDYGSGLDYLGVALGDFLMKDLIDEVFRLAAPSYWTVPVYAILDLGFDAKGDRFGTSPAGMHVRRAHRRPSSGMTVPLSGTREQLAKAEIELLLRSYGITTTSRGNSLEVESSEGALRVWSNKEAVTSLNPFEADLLRRLLAGRDGARFERINVQLAEDVTPSPLGASVVDFGHVNVKKEFRHPICSPVRDRPLCMGGVLWPEDEAYVQPDPRIALPLESWDHGTVNEFCFGIAARFRNGELSCREVRSLLHQASGDVVQTWRTWSPGGS